MALHSMTKYINGHSDAVGGCIALNDENMHKQLFMDLSLNIRAVISQRLVLSVEGKRCAAIEILINTPHIGELILKGEIDGLKEAMAD